MKRILFLLFPHLRGGHAGRVILPFLLLLIAVAFAGCASVTVDKQGRNLVTVQNSGCYLFYILPLCSGDPDYPNQQVCNWFDDTVKVETNVRLLQEAASEHNAHGIRNIVSHRDEEVVLWLILKRKIYRTSAELILD